jgi:hypothetical protein
MNYEGLRRERLWPVRAIRGYYSNIYLETEGKHDERQDSRCRGRGPSPGASEYEAEVTNW